jgi:hypothetical protein
MTGTPEQALAVTQGGFDFIVAGQVAQFAQATTFSSLVLGKTIV